MKRDPQRLTRLTYQGPFADDKPVAGEWHIVKSADPTRLRELVDAYLDKGWSILGAPLQVRNAEICQALIFTGEPTQGAV